MGLVMDLKDKFNNIFKEPCDGVFFAPGRVNLIGEHTDYNGGNVFPCAINLGTYIIARKREDKNIRMVSLNFEDIGIREFSLENLENIKEDNWCNYSKGVIWALKNSGFKIDSGFEALVYGNIPNGAGLSSSASLEVATAVMLKDLFNLDVDMIEIAKLSQRAENDFIGVNCGIMDQFAIAMGKENKAIFLDTNKLKYEYVNFNLEGIKLVIGNTNKRRGLADSKYNERRAECEKALEDLKQVVDIENLGELSESDFKKYSYAIDSKINRVRAKHAIYENRRTIKAVSILKDKDIAGFGELMNQSHQSLKEDYEVTGKELDTLVDLAQKQEGVIGSRMTGAGFGGCTISLVKDCDVDKFIENVGRDYEKVIGYSPSFYVVEIGDGAKRLE
ncbi:MAG: galactokinase [Sarcina sp.]